MRHSVTDFHEFYTNRLGGMVAQTLAPYISDFLAPEKNYAMSYGYAFPFVESTTFFPLLLPGALGIKSWPDGQPNRVAIIDEYPWPIETNSVDRLLMVHGLEFAQDPEAVLKEAWRVLKSQGRMKLIIPNRIGLWARSDKNIFGYGRPYSSAQLWDLLRACNFVKEKQERALFTPPFNWRWLIKAAPFIEKYSAWLLDSFGGVHIVEVSKQLYAGLAVPSAETVSEKARLAVKPTA